MLIVVVVVIVIGLPRPACRIDADIASRTLPISWMARQISHGGHVPLLMSMAF